MAATDRSLRLWWLVPAVGFLALIALALVFGEAPEQKTQGNSYDASPKGFRAAYVILDELGYPVTRSRRPGDGSVRFVLQPTASLGDAEGTREWVEDGGVLVLGDNTGEFSKAMGLNADVQRLDLREADRPATGPGVKRLAGGPTYVTWPNRHGDVWARADGKPFVTVYPLGDGEVWLLNRPEFVRNRFIGQADNAVLLARMADEVLRDHPGQLAFDEYYHGMRERPGIVRLLCTPPTLWITLEALLILGLVLWRQVPRFGPLRPIPPQRRRSKEEFLDAMASLLERKGDYADAYRTARDGLAREIEREFGLPAGTPPEVAAREAERRRLADRHSVLHVLTAEAVPTGAGPHAFLTALNELETIRHELLDQRRRPR
jgi:hypothetical protein